MAPDSLTRFRQSGGWPFLLLLAFVAAPPGAGAQPSLADAVSAGTALLDVRLRHEAVEQADKPKPAQAQTIRVRLGYETARYRGFTALAEVDAVGHIGAERFNSTINGRVDFPVIADPDMLALNRLQLSYAAQGREAGSDLRLIIGRQRIFLGNGRFIGHAEWRQHEQSFDAVTVSATPFPGAALTYSYVTGVNRVFGPDSPMGHWDSRSHLLNGVYSGLSPAWRLEAYGYLLDLKPAPLLSTATYGARSEAAFALGSGLSGRLNAAYAHQTEYGRNTLELDLSYYLGEAGVAFGGFAASAGYEVFEGNGTMALQTPLANLHPFQGFAETFLMKPPEGLRDAYVRAVYSFAPPSPFRGATAAVIYHAFSAEALRAAYGNEWDLSLEGQVRPRLVLNATYASYDGEGGPFPDKRVLWLSATYRY